MLSVVTSAVLLVLGVLAYRRHLAAGGFGLALLRASVLVLLGSILVGVVLRRTWQERPRRVVVLADRSASMRAMGLDSLIEHVLERLDLPAGVRREDWSLADSAQPGSVAAGQDWTRIGAAIERVGRTRPGAVLVVSDGQDNGEVPAVPAAQGLGVPVYAVGLARGAARNLAVTQVVLPAVAYAGDTALVRVRVTSTGFEAEQARVRLGAQFESAVLGPGRVEQELEFRHVFANPGAQVLTATGESLAGEASFDDNRQSVTVDVRPGRYRVVYLTNRPGLGTRFVLDRLGRDERVVVQRHVALAGGLSVSEQDIDNAQVIIIDAAVEQQAEAALWQRLARRVRAGAGVLVLAGPEFRPGPSIASLLAGRDTIRTPRAGFGHVAQGSFAPELAPAARVLPWFEPGSGIDLALVPPFSGVGPAFEFSDVAVWLRARETGQPLLAARREGRGKVVYAAGYPLWRWGFGPDSRTTALDRLMRGLVRYLAEQDTSPFALAPDKPGFLKGEPVRLALKAVGPDGSAWAGLAATVQVQDSAGTQPAVTVPMIESGAGLYEAAVAALPAGAFRARARVSLGDSVVGTAAAGFAIAEQSVELAHLGLNQGLLQAVAAAGGGEYYRFDSLPGPGFDVRLGTYERKFLFEPRRATWAYVLVALLAGLEWILRRRKGLL